MLGKRTALIMGMLLLPSVCEAKFSSVPGIPRLEINTSGGVPTISARWKDLYKSFDGSESIYRLQMDFDGDNKSTLFSAILWLPPNFHQVVRAWDSSNTDLPFSSSKLKATVFLSSNPLSSDAVPYQLMLDDVDGHQITITIPCLAIRQQLHRVEILATKLAHNLP